MTESTDTQSKLISVYQKVNPSTYAIETDEAEYLNREQFLSGLIHRRLCFPERMFQGSDLIEFGSGTGEHSLFYQLWGANGTYVEINDQATARMQSLFEHFELAPESYRIINQSIFDFKAERSWDIVATMGVLHHLENKEQAFACVASCVAPGGYLLFGIANRAGSLQRNLQRLIIHRLAGSNHEAIETIAERLFTEHLDRAERFGRRSRKAIIYDTWVNPKIDSMSIAEVFQQFADNGLEPYSMWPPAMPALLGDSPNRSLHDPARWPAINALAELGWLAHRDDDQVSLEMLEQQLATPMQALDALSGAFNDQSVEESPAVSELRQAVSAARSATVKPPEPYATHWQQARQLLAEIDEVLVTLEQHNIDALEQHLSNCKVLFRGTAGLGMSYYIAHRPEEIRRGRRPDLLAES